VKNRGVRRELPTGTVTLVFTDMEGSTALLRSLGDRFGDVLADHDRLLRTVWTQCRGVEVGNEGDAFFVAFASAPDALTAVADAQRTLAAHAWPGPPVRVRIGVHTGTPEVREDGYWGHDVHYAARLGAAAHGGQVLVSDTTRALAGPEAALAGIGEHGLKDFPEPRPLFQLVIDGVGPEAFPPPRTLGRHRSLPPRVGVVGREADVDALARRVLGDQHLISIVGPGGSGKTRLAVELGHRVAGEFPDGVTFVGLEALSDAESGPTAVAHALGLAELAGAPVLQRVVDHLRDRRALLVLDNYEHMLDAAPDAAELAAAGDGVRVIVTSQVPLHVTGEHVYPLAPLDADDGVELLVQRARAAAPGFALTEANAGAVRALVERLEGMPLAIELAAGRLALLEPDALLRRLGDSLEALGRGGRDLPARQRGLRAVLDWTTSVLEPRERETLGRLSVFAGGFGVQLAEDAFGDVLDDLAALVDAGLVRRDAAGRLSLAPPVRRYAAELLGEGADDARRAHAAALGRLAGRCEPVWALRAGECGPALAAERENLLEALAWARHGDPAAHAEILAGATWWFNYNDLRALAREHLDVALARAGEDLRLRARLLEARGTLGLETADSADSEAAAQAWAAVGDPVRQVSSLCYAAGLETHRDRQARGLELAEQAAAIARATGDPELLWLAEVTIGLVLPELGRAEEAIEVLAPLLARVPPTAYHAALPATALADAELYTGRDEAALRHYGMAIRALASIDNILGIVVQSCTVAIALARLGRTEDAAVVIGVCHVVHRERSSHASPFVVRTLAEAEALIPADVMAAGRARADALGIDAGLAFVAHVAR
jgi:predicted ATPase/class 3 adenylate cyclase